MYHYTCIYGNYCHAMYIGINIYMCTMYMYMYTKPCQMLLFTCTYFPCAGIPLSSWYSSSHSITYSFSRDKHLTSLLIWR